MAARGAVADRPRPRDPILPMKSIVTDHMGVMSAWFLAPFCVKSSSEQLYQTLDEPDVSQECRDYVLNPESYEADAARMARAELAEYRSLEGDLCSSLRYMEAGNPSVRDHARKQGCKILQRVEGERGEGTLQIWPVDIDVCRDLVAEMQRRQKWVLAQLDAKIDEATDISQTPNEDGSEIRRQRRRARELAALRRRVEVSIPDPQELLAFFIRFERVRLEGTQDARYKQQKSLEGRIDQFFQLEQQALAAAQEAIGA